MTVWDLRVNFSVKSNNELSQIDLLEKIKGLLEELTSFDDVNFSIQSVTSKPSEEKAVEETEVI